MVDAAIPGTNFTAEDSQVENPPAPRHWWRHSLRFDCNVVELTAILMAHRVTVLAAYGIAVFDSYSSGLILSEQILLPSAMACQAEN